MQKLLWQIELLTLGNLLYALINRVYQVQKFNELVLHWYLNVVETEINMMQAESHNVWFISYGGRGVWRMRIYVIHW